LKIKLVPGNDIALLEGGGSFFPALVEAIDRSAVEVRLENYIYANDAAGEMVAQALMRAARRGVGVYVLLDAFGSRDFSPARAEAMRDAGVSLRFYRPELRILHFRRSRLRRLHRKIALVDGRVGFVGGLNIIDDLTEVETGKPRFDLAVRIEGPLLAEIYPMVVRMWQIVTALAIGHRDPGIRSPQVSRSPAGEMTAALLVRDNVFRRREIEEAYLDGIRGAKREVIIASAYFLPGRRIRHELVRASVRGVKVTLLLQGWTDHAILKWATRSLYGKLLAAGIAIHEYEASELHAKAAVVDERWATVGSSNLDPFSLVLSREANVAVFNATFARTLKASLGRAIAEGAVRVDIENWGRRTLWQRLKLGLAYMFARVAMGMMGFRQEWF
jgi:cardiolipin synthase